MTSSKNFSDVAARLTKKREEKAPTVERNHGEVHAIRARILGVLLHDARRANNQSEANVAAELGVSESEVRNWEYGQQSPSLPQLEMIAYFLDVPVSQFWNDKTLGTQESKRSLPVAKEQYSELRNRMIGLRLAMARKEEQLSQEELANSVGLTPEQIADYEFGRQSIPFPELTSLSSAVRQSMSYFLEDTGRIGNWLQLQEEYRRFSQLPDEVRAFVAQPLSQPFIEIAMRLSNLPLQELRTVAEKILDITL